MILSTHKRSTIGEELTAIERRARRFFGLPPCESLRWESPSRSTFPESFATSVEDAGRRNDFARAYLWRHATGPRPAVVCIHGYRSGHRGLDGRAFDVPWMLRRLGVDVALVTLP